jgi:FkbM family methyltransferase
MVQPNYAFKEVFQKGDIAVDIGTGDDPDFSVLMIRNYGLECYAFDPTRKHASVLRNFEEKLNGFHYFQYAFGSKDGRGEFFESIDNMSGSLLKEHRNIINDRMIRYDVEMITMGTLLSMIPNSNIAIMKIDIEGAEFDFIKALDLSLLNKVKQLIIEFHHDTIANISLNDTKKAVARIKKSGMKAFSYNGRDYLFYW